MAARDRLVLSTINLMRRHGIAGTGVSDILADSGVARRSIYLNYPGGKPEMVADATQAAGQWISGQIARNCADAAPDAALVRFIASWKALLVSSDFTSGCPIVAAALARTVAPGAADAAANVFNDWIQILAESLRNSGVSKDRARTLASTAVAAIEGAVIISLAQQNTAALDDVKRELTILTQHAMEDIAAT